MTQGPIGIIKERFGWPGFPDLLFYQTPNALRFDLGGELKTGPVRFMQAIDRARSVASVLFEEAASLTAVVSHFSGEKRTRRDFVTFKKLREIGFPYPFGQPDKVPQNDESYKLTFGEDLCRYWYSTTFPNDSAPITALLWAALSREQGITPRTRWLEGIYLVDFDRGLALWAYDDRGMDIVATDARSLQPIYDRFGAWLLDYDRATMDANFQHPADVNSPSF